MEPIVQPKVAGSWERKDMSYDDNLRAALSALLEQFDAYQAGALDGKPFGSAGSLWRDRIGLPGDMEYARNLLRRIPETTIAETVDYTFTQTFYVGRLQEARRAFGEIVTLALNPMVYLYSREIAMILGNIAGIASAQEQFLGAILAEVGSETTPKTEP